MKTMLPTLTKDGYIEHIPNLLISLYEDFLLVDYSQTVCFYGSIKSLKYIIQQHYSDIDKLKDVIREEFYDLVTSYINNMDGILNNIDVDVEIKEIDNNNNYYVNLNVFVTYDNIPYELKREITINTNSFLYDDTRINYLLTGEIYG